MKLGEILKSRPALRVGHFSMFEISLNIGNWEFKLVRIRTNANLVRRTLLY